VALIVDAARKFLAVLIALRGLTNFAKPFRGGFVILGRLMHGGAATMVVAPLVGVVIVVYAFGLWHARAWARPLGIAYAAWATLNVVLFRIIEGVPPQFAPWMYAAFAVPGIVGPWLAVWLLGQRRA
jgi:hypothetical protein